MNDPSLRAAREYGLPRWRSEMTMRRSSAVSISIADLLLVEGLPDRWRDSVVLAFEDLHQARVREPQPAAQSLHHLDGERRIVADPEHEASRLDDEYPSRPHRERPGVARHGFEQRHLA